jgi:hypothetical protein
MVGRTLRLVLPITFIITACLSLNPVQRLLAESSTEDQEVFKQLSQAPLDSQEIYFLRDARITRGGAGLYFNRGFVGFFGRGKGEITGAVFSGDGEILLIPPDLVEKRSLATFTKSPILEERFTSAYLRFTDGTANELLQKARKPDRNDPEQPDGFADHWNLILRILNSQYSVRILQDLLGHRDRPIFHATLEGTSLGTFEFDDDERQIEAVHVGAARHNEGGIFADIWCSFPSRRSEARKDELAAGDARVLSYRIDTRIAEDNHLEGLADLLLESRSGSSRLLVFELSHLLEVSSVMDGEGRSLWVIPSRLAEETDAAARKDDWVAVVLPAAPPVGSRYRLIFAYRGNVIDDVGNGVLSVGAHGAWYPSSGLGARAPYELIFHYPSRLTLVATGRLVEESTLEGEKYGRWITDGDFPVAGFNLGEYRERDRRVGNVSIEVYATKQVEAELERRVAAATPSVQIVTGVLGEGSRPIRILASPPTVSLNPSALLDRVAESAADAVRYFETLFGPFPYTRLAISQIPGRFGQGWPELVYLPTLSFLRGSDGAQPDRHDVIDLTQNQLSISHEIAHQWWGNEVGWETYHDQWLSEGFASYAAALELARDKGGDRKFHELLRQYKQDLLSKNKYGATVESGGPIWLGQRLSNSLNPEGYKNIVYKKSCWVLHMLHSMMTDPKTGSDGRFSQMLRDFISTYRGRNPSTEDFERFASRYMAQAMDLDRTHQLGWFLAAWVHGTGIPIYELKATTRRAPPHHFVIQGTIEQSGVSPDFEMLVPVAAMTGRDRKTLLGWVAVGEGGGRFRFTAPFRPSRVGIDYDMVLAEVR